MLIILIITYKVTKLLLRVRDFHYISLYNQNPTAWIHSCFTVKYIIEICITYYTSYYYFLPDKLKYSLYSWGFFFNVVVRRTWRFNVLIAYIEATKNLKLLYFFTQGILK